MKWKKLVLVALAAMMVVTAAGCGISGDKDK